MSNTRHIWGRKNIGTCPWRHQINYDIVTSYLRLKNVGWLYQAFLNTNGVQNSYIPLGVTLKVLQKTNGVSDHLPVAWRMELDTARAKIYMKFYVPIELLIKIAWKECKTV